MYKTVTLFLISALIVHEYVNWTDPTSDCLLIRSCGEVNIPLMRENLSLGVREQQ